MRLSVAPPGESPLAQPLGFSRCRRADLLELDRDRSCDLASADLWSLRPPAPLPAPSCPIDLLERDCVSTARPRPRPPPSPLPIGSRPPDPDCSPLQIFPPPLPPCSTHRRPRLEKGAPTPPRCALWFWRRQGKEEEEASWEVALHSFGGTTAE